MEVSSMEESQRTKLLWSWDSSSIGGFMGLFSIDWGVSGPEGKVHDEYRYSTEPPIRIECETIKLGEGDTMAEEYAQWRKHFVNTSGGSTVMTNFKERVAVFSAIRRAQYMQSLSVLEDKYSDQPRIVILRIQEEPDEPYQPPKNGTFVIVWNPIEDSRFMSLQDRSLGVPYVLAALIDWLKSRKILDSGYFYLRDASNVEQGIEDALHYETVYRHLFRKAMVHAGAVAGSYQNTWGK